MERKRLRALLAEWIRKRNLTQREAGQALGTFQPVINHIENGRDLVSLEQLLVLWQRTGGAWELILTGKP